jgi:DNA replication protein DnaC
MNHAQSRLEKCPLGRCDGYGWVQVDRRNGRPIDADLFNQWVYTDAEGGEAEGLTPYEREERPCECLSRRTAHNRARRVMRNVPQELEGVRLDRWPITNMPPGHVAPLRAFVRDLPARIDAGEGLWVWGRGSGTGKTTVAVAAHLHTHDKGYTSGYWPMRALLSEINNVCFRREEKTEEEAIDDFAALDLLVLDDLGTEQDTDFPRRVVFGILDARAERGRATVVSTNLDEHELRERYDPRIVSRMWRLCGEPHEFTGPDHRAEAVRRRGSELGEQAVLKLDSATAADVAQLARAPLS